MSYVKKNAGLAQEGDMSDFVAFLRKMSPKTKEIVDKKRHPVSLLLEFVYIRFSRCQGLIQFSIHNQNVAPWSLSQLSDR